MAQFLAWLNQGWGFLVAVTAGVTLLWNFRKTFKDIKKEVNEPFAALDKKIDSLGTKLDGVEAHNNKVDRALLTIQRNSLLRSCAEFLKKGFATMEEKSTISEQYTSYCELGGNSFVGEMVAKVMNLPIEKPSKKKVNTDQ